MTIPPGCSLTLIGVMHRDPRGVQRLVPLLEQLDVDGISLEVSEYALEYRLREGMRLSGKLSKIVADIAKKTGTDYEQLMNHGEIRGILETLTVPFEVRAAMEFGNEYAVPYHLLDNSDLSRELLATIEPELINPLNITYLLAKQDFDYQNNLDLLYEEGSRILRNEPVHRHELRLSDETIESHEQRDELIASRLERLMDDTPGNWVHICGFTHMVRCEGFRNIYSRFPGSKRILAMDDPDRKRAIA